MKKAPQYISAFLLVAGLLSGATGFAQNGNDTGTGKETVPKKIVYPLTTCVVTGNKLGDMGSPVDYIHKEAGKPDRLVRFCCKNCIKDFKKDPAKYLKKIDDAARKSGTEKTGAADT